MKNLLTACAFVLSTVAFTACQQSTATTNAASGMGTFTNSGPNVELIKKASESYEKGDWDAYRACFSDSALAMANEWPMDSTTRHYPIDTVVKYLKMYRPRLEYISVNQPIYEVVTDSVGNTYGHVWTKVSQKNRGEAKVTNTTSFTSYAIKNGKITYSWTIMGGAN